MNRSSVLRIAFALAAFLATAWLATAATPPDAQPVILIQNATVLTVTQGTMCSFSKMSKILAGASFTKINPANRCACK